MVLLVVSALTLLVLFFLPYYWFRFSMRARLTANIPGPKPYPFIGNALEFGSDTVDIIRNIKRLWKEYGNVFRVWLGPNLFIILSEAKYVEHLLNSTSNITKNMTYKFLESWLGTGLLTSTGSKWKHRRKIITPTFHFKILEEFVDIFNTNGNILIKKLNKEVGSTEFDIYSYITLCALDNICESAMGVQMNVQSNCNSEYVSAIKTVADITMIRSFRPWLFPNLVFNASQQGKQYKKSLKILHDTTKKVIASRKKELSEKQNSSLNTEVKENDVGQKKRLAFLDLLLQYMREGGILTDEDLREEVDTFMFEGHDTTASAMSFCLWLLSQHPQCQERAYEELHEIFGNTDRDATIQDLQDMKYIECVIKESLRLYPSVPFFARLLDEEMHLDGLHLARGTNVIVSPFFMNRNPEYFPDPEKFDPERFSTERSWGRNPYAYVPFSAGPRNCIGQRFAMLEMKFTISKVLRNFKLLPSAKKLVLSTELVLRNMGGIFLKIENRK